MTEKTIEKKQPGGLILDDGHIESVQENLSPEELYGVLISHVKKYHPSDDISLIEKAYKTANEAHKDQYRRSGEKYIIHPLCVAIILAEMQLDKESIAAGLLHDVVEDTVMTTEELRKEFGEDVALIVDGVTKLEKLQYNEDKLEFQADNLRKMFIAMAKDIRVIMVKLADRLHNMRTLQYMPPHKQVEIAKETMDIYAPLAERLGISKVKVELDDLSLKYLEPEVYYDLVDKIAIRKSEREKYVQGIVEEVSRHIENAGIKFSIDGRVKHFFSIYKKMLNQDKTIEEIYDLFAIRVLVETVRDCYAVLGIIHEMYKPIPGRFKDYIAMPKANMYQSLHTTLINPGGQPFEIQIRTYEMHKTAEYGIAAHWKYKEASDGKLVKEQEAEKLTWLRQILEWQKDTSDNREFLNMLKSDMNIYSDNVYCFTQGDARLLGCEAGIDVHPMHRLHIGSTFSMVDAVQLHQPDDSRYLPFTPAPRLTGEVKYELTHDGRVLNNAFVAVETVCHLRQNHYYRAHATETATPSYTLINAQVGTDVLYKKRKIAEVYLIGENLTNRAYHSHLSRLKYLGDRGYCEMGRNVVAKIIISK